jgi:choline dehydrogenase-like flavoprotein
MASGQRFDFIVAGGGTAGCVAAARLARSTARPAVLLVEAGGTNGSLQYRIDGERWNHKNIIPGANWDYLTKPQEHLNDRQLDYSRGKGLGGSSVINFGCYTVAPKDDHDEIARLVGDDEWKWENAHQRYKRLESYKAFTPDIPCGVSKYLAPNPGDHGHQGPLKIGFPTVWEPSLTKEMDHFFDAGVAPNPDTNSGNPLGLAICPNTAYKGERTNSSDFLTGAPKNLHIVIDAQISRIVFEGRRAVGVETLDGRKFFASIEVLLSAGPLDTPRILMHSGIGPVDQLRRYGIPVLLDNPSIGQNLQDHYHISCAWQRAESTTTRPQYYRDKKAQEAARKEWEESRTGPLAELSTCAAIGFFKSEKIYDSKEFKELPFETRQHLLRPTVPSYEITLNAPWADYFTDPENTPANSVIFMLLMNSQCRGSVTLQSSDPSVPLVFDPKLFSHPYDRKVAVEAYRDVSRIVRTPAYAKDTVQPISAPKSDSEEDILAYWREHSTSTWHMSCTVSMGKLGDPKTCVDTNFRVLGVSNLRVSDLSVLPVLTK